MTVWGKLVYSTQRTTDMLVKRYSRIVIPSVVEGSFLHTGIASMWDSGKRETFSERSKKWRSVRKISRYARNDGMAYSIVCVIAENGETFSERSKKWRSARRISRCARNDGMGNGSIPRSVQRICLKIAILVLSSRAKSRDLFCIPV